MTKYTDEDKNLVILLRNQGYKIKHITAETGCGESWVKKVISQNNKVTELEQNNKVTELEQNNKVTELEQKLLELLARLRPIEDYVNRKLKSEAKGRYRGEEELPSRVTFS